MFYDSKITYALSEWEWPYLRYALSKLISRLTYQYEQRISFIAKLVLKLCLDCFPFHQTIRRLSLGWFQLIEPSSLPLIGDSFIRHDKDETSTICNLKVCKLIKVLLINTAGDKLTWITSSSQFEFAFLCSKIHYSAMQFQDQINFDFKDYLVVSVININICLRRTVPFCQMYQVLLQIISEIIHKGKTHFYC